MPSNPSVIEVAKELYQKQDYEGASRCLASAVHSESPVEDRLLYGVVLARLRRTKEAAKLLSPLADSSPPIFEAVTWMSVVSLMNGEPDQGLFYAQKGVAIYPESSTAHSTLGDCHLSRREIDKAIASFKTSLRLNSGEATVYHNLGLALSLAGRSSDAMDAFKRAVELAPRVAANYVALSRVETRHSMVGDAIDTLKEGLNEIPDDLSLLSELAATYAVARNKPAAEMTYRHLIRLSPKSRLGYAYWLQEEGRFEESASNYRASIDEGINLGQAYYGLVNVCPTERDSRNVVLMREYAVRERLSLREAMYVHYGLGRALDHLNEFEEAGEAYDRANSYAFRIYQAGRDFSIAGLRETNDKIYELGSRLSHRNAASGLRTPIFIVGMIRSGTTLLEQILSSHSQVAPTGELRFWIEEGPRLALGDSVGDQDVARLSEQYLDLVSLMAGTAPFFTDKMPLNFAFLGIIRAALPNARFVHIRRNPVDTCLSIWMTFFGGGPQFVYDKANITAYYVEYQRMMNLWRTLLPAECLYEVDYELLVTDREAVTREILRFCGLEWDEKCLRHDENPSTVASPSRWQARQPLYTSSVGKWKNYEPWLGEFRALLPGPVKPCGSL